MKTSLSFNISRDAKSTLSLVIKRNFFAQLTLLLVSLYIMQHYMGRFGRAHREGLKAEKLTHPAY
jgi:hypothetical protein